MYLKKIKKRFNEFKTHSITKKNPYAALFRYVLFNCITRVNNKTRVYNWVNGLKFYARKGDAGIVGNIYYKLFDFEDSMFILDNLSENDVFIDVGANVGHFSLLAASVNCEVHAFEPLPETFERLENNVKLNNLKISLYNKGIGNKNEILNFSTNLDVMNSVTFDKTITSKAVEVVKLDDVFINKNPKMLKIDVEGFEWFVLDGAKNTLQNPTLNYILIELNNSGEKFSIKDSEIHQLLLNNNFHPFSYSTSIKKLIKIASYRTDKFNTLYVRN